MVAIAGSISRYVFHQRGVQNVRVYHLHQRNGRIGVLLLLLVKAYQGRHVVLLGKGLVVIGVYVDGVLIRTATLYIACVLRSPTVFKGRPRSVYAFLHRVRLLPLIGGGRHGKVGLYFQYLGQNDKFRAKGEDSLPPGGNVTPVGIQIAHRIFGRVIGQRIVRTGQYRLVDVILRIVGFGVRPEVHTIRLLRWRVVVEHIVGSFGAYIEPIGHLGVQAEHGIVAFQLVGPYFVHSLLVLHT